MNSSADIHIRSILEKVNFDVTLLDKREVRMDTLLYMLYWHIRLAVKPDEQGKLQHALQEYLLDKTGLVARVLVEKVENDQDLKVRIHEYVEKELHAVPTVDLVCMKDSKILCIQRAFYPVGVSLIGGLIHDDDESNDLNLPPTLFAALRVAGQKILETDEPSYAVEQDAHGNTVYAVSAPNSNVKVKIYPNDRYGYQYRENLRSVIRPSDTRHIVSTVGFKCFIEGELHTPDLIWKNKEELLSEVVFEHHREIISQVSAQTSLENELLLQEKDFVRGIIEHPFEKYKQLRDRFAEAPKRASPINVSFPELFPVVHKLLTEMYSDQINEICNNNPLCIAIRDKATISLRHVSLKNRTFCPYMPTIRAIFEAVAFFDIVVRNKKSFYNTQPSDHIIEHNPREVPHASYHMYRYKYRLDDMLAMVPNELIIPTFENLSATDLMKVRGIPIRFVGLSTDFIYVDEFEQSPEEFLMHDCNHSWRMMDEDMKAIYTSGMSRDDFFKAECDFVSEYLAGIKVKKTDSEYEKEMKKIKKIILFEVVHEDARPFLKGTIAQYVQQKEGGQVAFEVPHIDPKTGYMDVVDTLDTGISTLSYVRNKLQHGFYDQVDAQLPQIVAPAYRKSKYIAKAAYDMLVELDAVPSSGADLDSEGHIAYEWLMRRVCSVGPDNIHESEEIDEALKEFGDGVEKLNPKRYQA